MTWLNYHHLYYFRIIAREGSIAKASLKLRLGQPTLSTQLKHLEDALGQKLFERKNRKLFLTSAGKTALEYANEVFRLGDEMLEALQDQVGNKKPQIQIGIRDGVPKNLVLDLIFQVNQVSHCAVSVLEGKNDDLFRELVAHRIDLILSNDTPSISDEKGIIARSIARSEVIICAAPKYDRLRENFPRSLQGKPVILPPASSRLRKDSEHYFKMHQIQIEMAAETQDLGLQKLLAESGMGLLVVSELAVRDSIRQGKLISIGKLDHIFEEIWLISTNRRIENPLTSQISKLFDIEAPDLIMMSQKG